MTWVSAGPCAQTDGTYTINRAPQADYMRGGIVHYELNKPGEPIAGIWCADTDADREWAVKALRERAKR